MIAGINLYEIMRISPVFDILLCCSVIMFAVVLERFWSYRFLKVGDPNAFMERVKASIEQGKREEILKFCTEEEVKPLYRMIKVGILNMGKGRKNVSKLMEGTMMSEKIKLEKFLPILGTLGNSGVFIGLLGTVIGIIRAFKLLETSSSTGPTAIMIGIAEALIATAMGLLVSIPCVVLFNTFTEMIKTFSLDMEIAKKEFLTLLSKKK